MAWQKAKYYRKSKAANPAADQAATVEETSASTVSDRVKLFENRKP